MPTRPLPLEPHLSVEELGHRYRRCKDGKEKTRWQAIWLYAQQEEKRRKHNTLEVAGATGYTRDWVRKLIQRYNQEGPRGMVDKHQDNPGGDQRAILNTDEQSSLMEALQGKAPDGGLWTAPKVATWVKTQLGKSLKPSTAWSYLRRLGFSLQVPRPSHEQEATPEQQADFKKKPSK